MSDSGAPYVEHVTWSDVRNKVLSIDSELCAIIDDISPGKKYTLIKTRYPFGAKIFENVIFHLPNYNGEVVPITSSRLPETLKAQLNYSSLPLGILTNRSIEIYREMEDSVFSVSHFGSGLDIGIWEHFGWPTPYSISAGARSLYMVPKITDTLLHKKLKREFGVTYPVPKKPTDHWHIFKQIINGSDAAKDWYCEVIFLTNDWINSIKNDERWQKLHIYLLEKGWQHATYARNKTILDLVWQDMFKSLSKKGLKFNEYIVDTLKHLFFISVGFLPASAPFTGDENIAPLNQIQKAYTECYGLNDYVPTIMAPQFFSCEKNLPVYYSLSNPTLLMSMPKTRNMPTKTDIIRELRELVQHFLNGKIDKSFTTGRLPICDIISQLQFDFFHNKMYAYGQIVKPSREMPKQDGRLLHSAIGGKNDVFADSGSYVQGCIRIKTKDKEDEK